MKPPIDLYLSERSEANLKSNSSIKERAAKESPEGIAVVEVTTPDAPYGYTEDGRRRKAPLTEGEIAERARRQIEPQERCQLHSTPGCTPCRQLIESYRAASKIKPLPVATVGLPYKRRFTAPQSHQPCRWRMEAIEGWPLPEGLTVADGVISGTPTSACLMYFRIVVEDSSNPSKRASGIFSVKVNNPIVAPKAPSKEAPVVPPLLPPSEEKVRQELGIKPSKPKHHRQVWREFYFQHSLSLDESRALNGSRPSQDKILLAGMSPMNLAMFLTMPEALYLDYDNYKDNPLKPRILTSLTAYDTTSRKGRRRSRKAWQFAGIKVTRQAVDGIAPVSVEEITETEPEQVWTDSIPPRKEIKPTEPTITWAEDGETHTITLGEALKTAKANRKRLESKEQKKLPPEHRYTDRNELLVQQRFWDRRIESLQHDIRNWSARGEVDVSGTGAESFMVTIPLCPEGTQPAFDMVLVREYIRTAWGETPSKDPVWWRHHWSEFENRIIHRAILANVFWPKWRVTPAEQSRALLGDQSLWDGLSVEEARIRKELPKAATRHRRKGRTQKEDAEQNYRFGDVNAQREEIVRSTDLSIREVRPSGPGPKSDEQDFWKDKTS